MDKERFTSLTLDTSCFHLNYTVPREDLTYDDMMEMFKQVAIAMAFSEDQFLSMCVNYITEHGEDKYEVNVIENEF